MKIAEITADHLLARPHHFGAWGASHSNSKAISGEAARMAGIEGYDYPPETGYRAQRLASAFMSSIANSAGSTEPLFHGFKNKTGRMFQPGQIIELPLVATEGNMNGAAGYGITNNPNKIPTVVFEFPPGTPMAGYARWKKADAEEFGHTWSEAIVGGRFRVADVQERRYNNWKDGETFLLITLQSMAVYDPLHRGWIER